MNRYLSLALLVFVAAVQFTLPVGAAASTSGTLTYTALGDSLAFGILDLGRGGYVPRYAGYVRSDTGSNVVLNNLGQNGWTSNQLLNALRTNLTFRSSITNSQVVTWNIGGNDFLRVASRYRDGTCGGADNQECVRVAAADFKANWSLILAEMLALRSRSDTVIRTTDVYNPFAGISDYRVLKPYLDDVNNHIAATSAANNIPCAKVYRAFNGPDGNEDPAVKGYLSPYDPSRVHPSDLGHKVIADLLRDLGYAPLAGISSVAAPVLLTEEGTDRAAAVDSVTLVRDPFPVFTARNFSSDGRTRITLFAANLTFALGESASSVTAQAEDAQGRVYPLAIEYVGKVPSADALTQVVAKLPDELARGGDVRVSITVRGATSNKALISISPSAGG